MSVFDPVDEGPNDGWMTMTPEEFAEGRAMIQKVIDSVPPEPPVDQTPPPPPPPPEPKLPEPLPPGLGGGTSNIMAEPLSPILINRKSGIEHFDLEGQSLAVNLLAFWQWSASDLVSNVTRGRLAEFIVANALNIDVSGVRNDWDAFDLTTPAGLKVEVKSVARVQSWFQNRLSDVVFRTPKTRAWDATTNLLSNESRRQADVYVMALLHHEDKLTIDPLKLAQWSFFVVPTRVLDARKRSQHSITLRSLQALGPAVSYSKLSAAVIQAGLTQKRAV